MGEKIDAPRGKSILTEEERNSYHNIILLCPNHHTEIDKNLFDWPVEKLHMMKAEHELWVQRTLSKPTDSRKVAEQTVVASIIDDAVSLCRMGEWNAWTSWALASDPTWQKQLPDQIAKFRGKVVAAIWPKDFEEAIEGKFLITEGPFMDMSYRTRPVEFTKEEKSNLPSVLFDKMKKNEKTEKSASDKRKMEGRGKGKGS